MFTGEGRQIKKTAQKSTNLQAVVERVIQTLKHEVLNGFSVINEQHLDLIERQVGGQDVDLGGPTSKAVKNQACSCSRVATNSLVPSNDSVRPRLSRANAAWTSGAAPK